MKEEEKRLAGTAEMVQAKKSRETWTWDIFTRCTSLPTNSKEAEWKSIEHVLEMCGAQPLHLDPSTTLPMQFDMIARKFFHVEQPAHHHSFFFGRVCAFFPLFGCFIFIHFVQNLPNKKCSTASILHGACERVSKRDRKRVFGANTTCWCYNWFFFSFLFRRFSFFFFLCRTSTYTGTRPTAHFIKFSYATTNAPKRNWRGKMLMVKKTACI